MVNNAFMQFVDRAFLARESMASLEAVLPASMLAYIALGFFQSVVAYSGTFVAQYHGAGDREMCRRSYFAGMVIALVSGVLMIAAIPLGGWVFETFANGAEVIARQKTYYGICTAGGVCLFGQMAAQAYFTGLGRTRIVLWVNVIGNLVNIALDPILIFGWCGAPRLGIAGAAYATVFATAVQWAILAVAAHRATRGGLEAGDERREGAGRETKDGRRMVGFRDLVLRILRFGVPSGAYSVLNSLSFTIFVFFTGRVGHVDAAVSNAAFSICYLLFAPMEGFSLGAATLVGQARGCGDDAAARKVGIRTVVLGASIAAVASALVVVFRHPLLALYEPSDPALAGDFHAIGSTLFFLMAAWQVFDAADVIVAGALKGAGDTRFVMWWMLVAAFVVWMPLVWIVSVVHNTMPALWGTMIGYVVLICVGSLVRWYGGKWRKVKLV